MIQRFKIDAVHKVTSRLLCILQNKSPRYQHVSMERSMLGGITTPPTSRSATASDRMR